MLNANEFVVVNVRPQPRQRSHTAGHPAAHSGTSSAELVHKEQWQILGTAVLTVVPLLL